MARAESFLDETKSCRPILETAEGTQRKFS